MHLVFALLAAGSWLLRPSARSWIYLMQHGFELASYTLLAMLPYLMGAVIAWRGDSLIGWKTSIYVSVLIAGTVLAGVNNSGIWTLQPGLDGVWLVLFVQFIGFVLAGTWALDDPAT